ncbi:hypothetical protein [Haloarchaeobius amylolyticus]|uniref:hypothetical protein n=1 Tax=Haloarchaeobius amylolyticus TaxID=1198296 RepID=UPI002271FB47|nr:hypothetical protein [Haloarchaeobius amylolyticus]
MLTIGGFVAGLVLFVGGLRAIRTTGDPGSPANQVFVRETAHRDSAIRHVQCDGAVLAVLGLLLMLAVTLV